MRESCSQDSRVKVKITSTEIVNTFIKIKAQLVESDDYVALLDLKNIFKTSECMRSEDLILGENIYIAKLDIDNYARCRLLELHSYPQIASIDLFDHGLRFKISYNSLRLLPKSSPLFSIPPICKEFNMAELMICRDSRDYRTKFQKFFELLVEQYFEMDIVGENPTGKFVHLYSFDASIAHDIIPNHPSLKAVMKRIKLKEQMKLMVEQYLNDPSADKNNSLVKSPSKINLTDYISSEVFPVGVNSEVRISCYQSAKAFYVQSLRSLQELQDFHVKLQKQSFQVCSNPQVSDICLAHLDSNNVQRIQILEINEELAKVRLIDYGNERMINVKDILVMPDELKLHKPFAWKFSLHKIENLAFMNSVELNFYFQYITNDKRLTLCPRPQNKDSIPECTLFDGKENIFEKLKAYDPRKLLYPHREPLKDDVKVKVVNAESPKSFYINVVDSMAQYQGIFAEFQKFNSCSYRNPRPGSACCVKINDKCCRGQYEKEVVKSIFQVKLIDIGITDDFSQSEVKVMVDKFTKVPPLAYECCLIEYRNLDCGKSSLKSFQAACKKYQTFSLKIHNVQQDVYYVSLINEFGHSITDDIDSNSFEASLQIDLASNVDENENVTEKCEFIMRPNELGVIDIRPSVSLQDWTNEERQLYTQTSMWDEETVEISIREDYDLKGVITSVISPGDFTIQCLDSLPVIEKMLDELEKSADTDCPLTDFAPQTFCTARNPLTKKWCRGIIIDAELSEENSLITIRDVDNGYMFSTEKVNELKKPSALTMIHKHYGIRCKLPVLVKDCWEDEALRIVSELIGKEIGYKILACNKFYNILEVVHKGVNVAENLVSLGLARKLKVVPNGIALVAYIKNLNEFYVHSSFETEQHKMIIDFEKSYEQNCLRTPVKGMIVMAFSKEYKKSFRAKIVEVDNADIEVKYIDYGNREKNVKSNLGMINDPTIVAVPPLAHRCSFNLDKNIDPDSPEAIEHFAKLAKMGDQEFMLRMLEAKLRHSVVELYHKNEEKNILDELLPLCRKLNVEDTLSTTVDDALCASSTSSSLSN